MSEDNKMLHICRIATENYNLDFKPGYFSVDAYNLKASTIEQYIKDETTFSFHMSQKDDSYAYGKPVGFMLSDIVDGKKKLIFKSLECVYPTPAVWSARHIHYVNAGSKAYASYTLQFADGSLFVNARLIESQKQHKDKQSDLTKGISAYEHGTDVFLGKDIVNSFQNGPIFYDKDECDKMKLERIRLYRELGFKVMNSDTKRLENKLIA